MDCRGGDGMYRPIIGQGLYGWMYGYGGAGGTAVIPGRLIITSPHIRLAYSEAAVTGWKGHPLEYAAAPDMDGLVILSPGEPVIQDALLGLRATGAKERSIYADSYLVSREALYAQAQDEGLLIYFDGDSTMELEKNPIIGKEG